MVNPSMTNRTPDTATTLAAVIIKKNPNRTKRWWFRDKSHGGRHFLYAASLYYPIRDARKERALLHLLPYHSRRNFPTRSPVSHLKIGNCILLSSEEMGSEGPKAVTFHVTGFKKFQGVAQNPTETTVNNLKDYIERRGLALGVTLGSCTILKTAGDGALPLLLTTLESGKSQAKTNSQQVIWVHLGVNSGSSKFALERQAVNEATFRCPDQLGWKPHQHPIVPNDGEISRIRQTSLPIEAILKFLKKGFDVITSDDAGRFICNYVYYQSLVFAEQKGHKSLFVHVPLFAATDEDTQMQFVVTLFEAVA